MGADVAVTARPPAVHRRERLPLSEDERLAGLVGAGDEHAFTALYERYHQQLYRYARSLVRNDADAQDALQSALTNALLALREGRRDAPLKPWLYRIVHNESVSLLRRHRGHAELSEAMMLADTSTEERVEGRARLASLVADLQELPDRQRGALLMHELSGLSHEEIAAAFAVSNGVVRQLVYEARRSLQEFAEGRAMSCDDVCRAISDGDRRALRSRKLRAHMRECSGCTAFEQAIPERKASLKAIAPPIPALAAAGVLSHVLTAGSAAQAGATGTAAAAVGASSGSGGAAAAGAGSSAAGGAAAAGAGSSAGGAVGVGAATAGKTALVALSTKAVAGIAAVAVATAGAGVAVQQITSSPAAHHSVLRTTATSGGVSGNGVSKQTANNHSQLPGAGRANPGAATSHPRNGAAKSGLGSHGKSSTTPASGLGLSTPGGSGTAATGTHSQSGTSSGTKRTAGSSVAKPKRHHSRRRAHRTRPVAAPSTQASTSRSRPAR